MLTKNSRERRERFAIGLEAALGTLVERGESYDQDLSRFERWTGPPSGPVSRPRTGTPGRSRSRTSTGEAAPDACRSSCTGDRPAGIGSVPSSPARGRAPTPTPMSTESRRRPAPPRSRPPRPSPLLDVGATGSCQPRSRPAPRRPRGHGRPQEDWRERPPPGSVADSSRARPWRAAGAPTPPRRARHAHPSARSHPSAFPTARDRSGPVRPEHGTPRAHRQEPARRITGRGQAVRSPKRHDGLGGSYPREPPWPVARQPGEPRVGVTELPSSPALLIASLPPVATGSLAPAWAPAPSGQLPPSVTPPSSGCPRRTGHNTLWLRYYLK